MSEMSSWQVRSGFFVVRGVSGWRPVGIETRGACVSLEMLGVSSGVAMEASARAVGDMEGGMCSQCEKVVLLCFSWSIVCTVIEGVC